MMAAFAERLSADIAAKRERLADPAQPRYWVAAYEEGLDAAEVLLTIVRNYLKREWEASHVRDASGEIQ